MMKYRKSASKERVSEGRYEVKGEVVNDKNRWKKGKGGNT